MNLFLVRYPNLPVLVPAARKITIGRAGKNDIVLDENRTSRNHAVVRWEKNLDSYAITDLGSRNGTYINGEKIDAKEPHPLKDWDKVRIGTAIFTVRIVEDPELIQGEFKDFRGIADRQDTVVASREEIFKEPALSGKLEHLCPLELFQMLEVAAKSGVLELLTPTIRATFTISRGNVVMASCGDIRGQEAVYEVLRCTEGSFSFTPQEVSVDQPEISVGTTVLLMEGCRLLDEALSAGAN